MIAFADCFFLLVYNMSDTTDYLQKFLQTDKNRVQCGLYPNLIIIYKCKIYLALMSLIFKTTPTSVLLTFPAVLNVRSYFAIYNKIKTDNFIPPSINVINILPSTLYAFNVYSLNKDKTVVKQYSGSVTTPAVSLSAFPRASFQGKVPYIPASQATSTVSKESIVATNFASGDQVKLPTVRNSLDASVKQVVASVTKVSDTVAVTGSKALAIPFDSTNAAAQQITLTTTSTGTPSSVPITYVPSTNSVTVNGVNHLPGTSFILDGKLVYVKVF